MKEFKITKEKILAMAEECSEAKAVLKKGFPEAFGEPEGDWEDITSRIHIVFKQRGNAWYMVLMDGNTAVSIATTHVDIDENKYFTIKFNPVNVGYKIEIGNYGGNIRISKNRVA